MALAAARARALEVANTVTTPRLTLRPFRATDLPAYTALWRKPELVRYLPGAIGNVERADQRAKGLVEQWTAAAWENGGYAPWAALDRPGGRLIGHVGLRYLPDFDATEVMYLIDTPLWGRGLASEGARAACDFARDRLGLTYLVALATVDNPASHRVMEKAGFTYECRFQARGLEGVRYGRSLTG